MLTILGNGKSLKTLLVFTGKPKGPKETKLKSHPKVLVGYVYVCWQESSWVDEPTMRIYRNNIWFKEGISKRTKNTLLVMDRAQLHFSEANNRIFEENNSNYVLIPPRLTWVPQPLDAHINKIFKTNVRNGYHKWLINNNGENITDNIILDFIYNTWYNNVQNHKEDIIAKSFRDNYITLSTDGSEDSEFLKIPQEFIEEIKIENNDIGNKSIDDLIEEDNENDEDGLPTYIHNHNGWKRQ